MGRTSKFHFPIPGRKHTSSKDNVPASSPAISTSSNLSKAQRFLGADNDLNIDSPTREEGHPWRYQGSRSSGMSISISESTQSTNESGSVYGSQYDQLDDESGVFPRSLHGKASSTLLGQRYADDGATTNSSISGRLRNEGSSSTLRSYYDRQKSPDVKFICQGLSIEKRLPSCYPTKSSAAGRICRSLRPAFRGRTTPTPRE